MDIPYALRSEFLESCEQILTANQSTLASGGTVTLPLKAGGYAGNLIVTIPPGATTAFQAEWAANNITWFPSRIKAAATALRNCGMAGCFHISHAGGRLSITRGNAA